MGHLGQPYWSKHYNVIMHSSDHHHLVQRRVVDEKEGVEALVRLEGVVIKVESAKLDTAA